MTHAPPNAASDFGRGDKSHCGLMSFKRLILTPGDFLARRFDEGYAKFVKQIKRETRKGNRRLAIYSLLARAECGLTFVVRASASYFGFVIVIPLVLCIYPLIALGDPYMWRRVYGRLAEGVGYKASFLLNLDMLYWFALGWVAGWILMIAI
ncbi:hypothetical protein ES706_01586 [subsurface metagenome]|nr:hypothetical protein [Hadesarchaea archaeon]